MLDINERKIIIELFDKYKTLLSTSQSQILHLYLNEDLSMSEIANELAMTRSAVFDAIKKGKKKLIDINNKIGQ